MFLEKMYNFLLLKYSNFCLFVLKWHLGVGKL